MGIYENVLKACHERNTSVNALEQKFGWSRGVIYKWRKNCPSVDRVKRVADELKMTVDELLIDELAKR